MKLADTITRHVLGLGHVTYSETESNETVIEGDGKWSGSREKQQMAKRAIRKARARVTNLLFNEKVQGVSVGPLPVDL